MYGILDISYLHIDINRVLLRFPMSPPTPVLSRAEMRQIYSDQLNNPEKYECSLKSLSQNECTFLVSPDSSVIQQTICIPFKRIFQRCLVPYGRTVDGNKQSEKWINIEITDLTTNDQRAKYGAEVEKFLNAEQELTKWMQNHLEEK